MADDQEEDNDQDDEGTTSTASGEDGKPTDSGGQEGGPSSDDAEAQAEMAPTPNESPVPAEAAAVQGPGGATDVQPAAVPTPSPDTSAPPTTQAPAPTVQVTVNQPGAAAAPPAQQVSGASVSGKAVNLGTVDKLEKKSKAYQDPLTANLADEKAAEQDALARTQQDAQDLKDAQYKRYQLLADQQKKQAKGNAAIAKESAAWAEQERIASEQALNNTHRYAAQLDADMAKVRAMRVTNPIDEADTGTRAGLALSAFAQGFLGPKGIHIDSVGAINRAVDTQIRIQEEAIQRGEWITGQDRELWTMARAEAGDQAEARGRMRALKLAGMQADIQAHVDAVGSELAKADGAVAIAQIQTAADDTRTRLVSAYHAQAQDVYKTLLSAQLERMKIAIEEKRLQVEMARAKREAADKPVVPFLSPVRGDLVNGRPRVMGHFAPWATPEVQARVNASVGHAAKIQAALDNFEDAMTKAGGGRVIGGRVTRLDSDAQNVLKNARYDLAMATLGGLNPGEKPSQKLVDQFLERIPLPTETGASMVGSIKAAHLAVATDLNQAQIDAAPYVLDDQGQPLDLGKNGIGGLNLYTSTNTALPDPSKPGALELYTLAAASPTDPNGRPDTEAIQAVGGIYQIATDPKNPDRDKAVETLKTIADGDIGDVSPYLAHAAESFLLTPQLLPSLSKEDQAHYTRAFDIDEKRDAALEAQPTDLGEVGTKTPDAKEQYLEAKQAAGPGF